MRPSSNASRDADRHDRPPPALASPRGERRRAVGGSGGHRRGHERGGDLAGDGGRGRTHQRTTAFEAEQIAAEVLGGLVALVDVLRHRAEHDALHRGGDVGRDGRGRSRGLAYVLVRDRDRTGGDEGRDAGEHLVQHDAQGVHVGAAVEREALGLLGREVGGGAEHRAGLGEWFTHVHARDAEVGDLHLPLRRDEHVARLHVAVHDTVRVRERQGVGDLGRETRGIGRREPTVGVDHLAQGLAGHVLHHDVGRAVLLAPVVDGDDVRMVEARGRLRLAAEALDAVGVGRVRRCQDLDRDASIEQSVVREEHVGHAAVADRFAQLVAVREDAAVGGHGHGNLLTGWSPGGSAAPAWRSGPRPRHRWPRSRSCRRAR